MIKIATDAMGGDNGPSPIIEGLILALKKDKTFTAIAVGKKNELLPLNSSVATSLLVVAE